MSFATNRDKENRDISMTGTYKKRGKGSYGDYIAQLITSRQNRCKEIKCNSRVAKRSKGSKRSKESANLCP